MKKIYIALAVLAMTALAGCQNNELRDDTYTPKKGEILFRLASSANATKAADVDNTVKGVNIDLGRNEDGTNFFLEETITRLDDVTYGPETKGTPGYTENFHFMYGGFDATVYTKSGTDNYSVYEEDGRFEIANEDKLIYKRVYPNDIWDKSKNGNGMYFFLKAYEGSSMSGVSGLTYDTSDGSIFFHYDGSSLTTAEDQKDILFTSREITSESDYNKFISQSQGVPVLFHHVLTGVKFAIANYDATKKITIKEVVFDGLYDSGDCTVTPTASGWRTGETDVDDITDYSSAETSLWDNRESSGTSFTSGEFGTPVSYTTGNFGDAKNKYPTSFAAAGATNNLNTADASQTFWFVPQAMNENITLTITYTFGSDTPKEWTIDFGKILAEQDVEWLAGELHTYTIKIDDVNVRIEDTVSLGGNTTTSDPKGLIGSKKQSVKITNTGNTDAFIRASIVGQWVDESGRVVFGFTDEINQLYQVESWYEDQFVNHSGQHGEFIGLAGYSNTFKSTSYSNPYPSTEDGWYYNPADRYYYYIKPVAPGADTSVPLFTSYEILKIPHTTNAGEALSKNMYFVLEVATQAISARTSNGTLRTDYLKAWEDALSIDEDEEEGSGDEGGSGNGGE